MIVAMVGLGVGMGVQPLLGFCHGAKNKERFDSILKFSCFLGLDICVFCAILCFALAEPIVRVFLTEAAALADGLTFYQRRVALWSLLRAAQCPASYGCGKTLLYRVCLPTGHHLYSCDLCHEQSLGSKRTCLGTARG